MNFDNLVEDAEKHGASVSDSFSLHMVGKVGILFYEDELKALITQYILADREQGQEPVGYVREYALEFLNNTGHTVIDPKPRADSDIPLFTHAQPTPEQIAEIRKQTLLELVDYFKYYDNVLDVETELRRMAEGKS